MPKDDRPSLLIVDDEPIKCEVLRDALEDAGYRVDLAGNPAEALSYLPRRNYDVIITDIRMPGMDGITFLRQLREQKANQAVMVMTAHGSVESAVEAMKLGAFDYMQKPFSAEELVLKLDRVRRYTGLERENQVLREQLAAVKSNVQLVGHSESIRGIKRKIHAVANSDSTVLIEGRSGTGKEVVARLIHECSHRAKGPFVAVSCAALPEALVEAELFGHEAGAFTGANKRRHGRFELANGGTLFLDDIDDIPLHIQVKLLRVLQEYHIERVGGAEPIPVNIRLIAATKRNLRELVQEKNFREDVYYRLSVIPIYLPPLRERIEDILPLTTHFLARFARRQGRDAPELSADALRRMQTYHWPGNVRELEHVIEQAMVLNNGDAIESDDLPPLDPAPHEDPLVDVHLDQQEQIDLQHLLQTVEATAVDWALHRAGGNLARAAELLGMPRSTLQYRLLKLGTVTEADK